MTEKEKSHQRLLYNPLGAELTAERAAAKELCCEFNRLRPSDLERRWELIRKLLGKTKERFYVEQPFLCDYGYNIEVGENFYINHNAVILDCGKVTFGDNVFIGPNCAFYTPEHPLDAPTRNAGVEYAYPITVDDNVWIGGNAVVLGGVTIGSNAVIGAGSVVTRDIPSGVVAVGNPCRVVKRIEN
ncbi:maltose acetyltransferase [Clostridia bacterium]|nr:maltose acetyltransferase [Clostridia bacterium]